MSPPEERNSLRYDEGGPTPRRASEGTGEPASSVRAEPSPVADAPDAPEPTPDAVEAATGDGDGEPRTGRRRVNRWVPVAVLAVLVVLAAALAGTLFVQQRTSQQTETARDEGLTSSRAAARVLFSYDYRSLDKDFKAGLALTAGDFRNEYMRTTSTVVQPVAVQYKAVVRAEVVVAGVVSAKPHEATTIVFLNQTTTSTRVTGTKVDQSRVRMTVREIGGQWKVTAVTAL